MSERCDATSKPLTEERINNLFSFLYADDEFDHPFLDQVKEAALKGIAVSEIVAPPREQMQTCLEVARKAADANSNSPGYDGELAHQLSELRIALSGALALSARAAPAPEPEYTVGAYTLRDGMQRGKVWIEHETGEGGDFPAAMVEASIAAFYKEHF